MKSVSCILLTSFPCVGVPSANPPANGKQGPVAEEISQTLLINKKHGKNYYVHAAHILLPTFNFSKGICLVQ